MSLPIYPRYKVGPGWLGSVPDHWDIVPCKRMIRRLVGSSAERTFSVSLEDIQSWTGRLERRGATYAGSGIPFQAGDILFGKLRPYLAKAWLADCDGQALGDFHVLRSLDAVCPKFMNHLLLTQEMISQIDGSTYGAKMPRASWDFIGNLPVARPPLDEQERIAAFLDAELKKLDVMIAEKRNMASLAREKRQAYISFAVTCGLDTAAAKKASGFDWIGNVPDHWAVVRLKFLARVQSGIPKGRSMDGKESITVPYLRVANVQDGFLDLTQVSTIEIAPQELARFLLQHGDVLMNEGGDFDKLGRGQVWRGEIANCIHQNHVFAVRPHSVQSEWLALITTAHCGRFFFMSRAKQSTNLASISSSNLRELRVPMPPVDERLDILSAVQDHSDQMDKLAFEALQAAGFLRERRAALISAAITGKIDVRGLAPALQEAA